MLTPLSRLWLVGALIAGAVALASPSEAAIAFRASSQVQTGNYVNSFSVNKPAGVVDGDVMIMTAAMQDSNASTVLDPPAGWTLVRTSYLAQPVNFGQVLHTWWKVAEGEPASYTLSFPVSLSKLAVVGIVAYSGVDTGNPIDAEGGQVNTAASANVVAPSITTNRPNTFLVGAFALDALDPAPTYTPPGGMTERVDLAVANCCGGNWVSLELADQPIAAAGATGTRTAVASVGTHGNFGHLLALRPAFIVNSTGEQVDAAPGDGACLTGVATCTLRAAIQESNALAGRDAINFDIPGAGPHMINVLAAGLPGITGTVAINGYTEPTASANTLAVGSNAALMIELNGNLTVGVNGLTLAAGATNSTIKGLVINRFADYGIQVNATGAIVRGNYVGTNIAGNAGQGNNRDLDGTGGGIVLFGGSATIGGTSPTQRNVVSGNSANCVRGIATWESSGHVIQGNYVGTNAAGTAAIPNGCGGVVLDGTPGVGSDNNLIGGAVAGAGNLLSGNQIEGIFIQIGSDTNTIQGNIIGLDANGTAMVPNGAQGIKLYSAGNIVGGDTALERNVISGNTLAGILVEGEPADNNVIEGNYIGTDVTGTLDRGNSQTGITVWNGADNTRIGAPGAGNVISGNTFEGVYVFSATTTGTIVQGNKIGANAAGTLGIGNAYSGLLTDTDATGMLVGGIGAGEGNLIAFNTFSGVSVGGPGAAVATRVAILGNSIHTNTQLGIDLGNTGAVTGNDPGDTDTGPNLYLNFPDLTAATGSGGWVSVNFLLDVPAASYRVEFFRNSAGDEGQTFAGFRNVTHPGGALAYSHSFAAGASDILTATTTRCTDATCTAFQYTSEFSATETVACCLAGNLRVLSGSYVGNGLNNRPLYVGFQPEMVFVDRNDPTNPGTNDEAAVRTSTMPALLSKFVDGAAGVPLAGNAILSLDATGFTVGTDNDVNQAGLTYYWVAFDAAPGQMELGSYTGTPAAQNIAGLGFSPAYVLVLSAGAHKALQKTSLMPASFSQDFTALGYTDAILDMRSDGFRVGTNVNANNNGTVYHYVAWAPVPGKVAVGKYTGGAPADNRDITGTGFWPEWVVLNRSSEAAGSQSNSPVHKPASSGVGVDGAPLFDGTVFEADNIQKLQADGFQVGGHSRVNSAGAPNVYHWVAFGPHFTGLSYRSVGVNGGANLNTTPRTVTISGETATFSGSMPANVGVGDVLQYQVSGTFYLAFIRLRLSDTVYLVRTATGNFPQAAVAGTAVLVFRAYRSLFDWEAQAENVSINPAVLNFDTSTDLVSAGTNMLVACYGDGEDVTQVSIDGWTTDPGHSIRIFAPYRSWEVGASQRHNGVWDATKYSIRRGGSPGLGATINIGASGSGAGTNSVWIDGLQLWLDIASGNGDSGILVYQTGVADHRFSNNIIRGETAPLNFFSHGIFVFDAAPGSVVRAWNNIVYDFSRANQGTGIRVGGSVNAVTFYSYNNTVYNVALGYQQTAPGIHVAKNNVYRKATVGGTPDGYVGAFGAASDYNSSDVSGDAPVTGPRVNTASPWYSGATADASIFVLPVAAPRNLLLLNGTIFANVGVDLSADANLAFSDDVEGQVRPGGAAWDLGADEYGGTTAVKLQSFVAAPGDASVTLEWRTASELDNLGFHLYRGPSEGGPWTRLNASLVPGLGSSAVGRAYSYRDSGLVNGTRYYYRLEDVDASSKTTSHGPVSAVPLAGAPGGAPGSEPEASGARKKGTSVSSCPDWVVAAYGSSVGSDAATASLRCTRHGNPEAVSFGVVSRDSRQATLELKTGGFYALHEASGKVRVYVPGFDFPQDPQAPALPVRRALVDAVVGRRVQLGGVRALDQLGFSGLVPVSLGKVEMEVSRDGTVRAGRRALRESSPQHVSTDLARLLPSVFQGETKSAVVQLTPLRFDARRQQIVLARRVLVKLLFTGRETGENGRGSFGRRPRPEKPVAAELLARLYTTGRGLHAVSFERLFPGRQQGLASLQLRLVRQGQAQGVHVEPASDVFGPGSVLYFNADTTASSTDFSSETAWELLRATDGLQMPLVSATPSGSAVTTASTGQVSFEVNRFYQPGLLEAPELWLWEALASGATRTKSFSLSGVDAASLPSAQLDVILQGASESGSAIDHHVSVSLNGSLVGEAQFAGKKPYRMSLSVAPSLLHDGANELSLTNVADTGVSSFVFLDRFAVSYPQTSSLASGVFEGTWAETGTATVSGVASPVALLDVTASPVPGASSTTVASSSGALWLAGYESAGGALRFRAEAGHRYLAVSQQALVTPRVAVAAASSLRATTNQADYLLIAPRAFLAAAEPLLARRADQGLTTRAIAFEEIADEFGHGQPSAEAIRGFLAFAFQSWARPSPRYVLLLGDATYDPRNFIGTSQASPLPALWTKTSYLWTASDPQLAAVNGEDALPDLAIGRLPATTVEEAQKLVEKLIAWEDSGQGLAGAAGLVADNPDLAGDFDANVDDIARSFLQGRAVSTLKLSELGAQTRPAILDALNSGLSLLSYVGHGGAAVWASENVWNSWDAPSLLAQSRQPFLLTMNCLNGYFVAPAFDSLAESLLKTEGRGAIAAFSPSGLSLDGPAHQYHRALMAELTSGQHERLGDAVLAAQKAYAQSGLMPELLSVYHLLGDPAMRIR